MPAKRLSMRKIRDVLRLHFQGRLTNRQIACSLGRTQTIHESLLRYRICPHLLRCASSPSSTYCIEYAFVGLASRALQLRASPLSRDGFHE